jgi:hypothetical protein
MRDFELGLEVVTSVASNERDLVFGLAVEAQEATNLDADLVFVDGLDFGLQLLEEPLGLLDKLALLWLHAALQRYLETLRDVYLTDQSLVRGRKLLTDFGGLEDLPRCCWRLDVHLHQLVSHVRPEDRGSQGVLVVHDLTL